VAGRGYRNYAAIRPPISQFGWRFLANTASSECAAMKRPSGVKHKRRVSLAESLRCNSDELQRVDMIATEQPQTAKAAVCATSLQAPTASKSAAKGALSLPDCQGKFLARAFPACLVR